MEEHDGLLDGAEQGKSGKALELMFKSTYRVHVNLSNIADNKANIMISINALMLSIVFSSLIANTFLKSAYWIPFGVLVAASLTSIIFAALSAMPRVKTMPITLDEVLRGDKGMLFFGNYTQLKPDEFYRAIEGMMDDKMLVYKNMSTDLYVMGLVLSRKYKLLRVSYQSFTIGLVGAAVLFPIVWALT